MATNKVSINSKVRGRSRYLIMLMTMCATFAVTMMSAKSQAMAPFFAVDLKLDAVQVGQVLGAYTIGMLPLLLLGGILADFFGGKIVTLFALFGGAIFSVLMAQSVSYNDFYITSLIFGLAYGAITPGCMRLLSNWFPASEMATATSRYFTGMMAASIVGMPVSILIATSSGWRVAFYFVAAVAVPFALWILFFGHERPENKKNIDPEELRHITEGRIKADKPSFRELLSVLSNRNIIIAILAAAIGNSTVVASSTWLYMGLMSYRGVNPTQIAIVMPIVGLVAVAYGMFAHGWVVNHVFKASLQNTALFGGLFFGGLYLLLAFWTTAPWVAYYFIGMIIAMVTMLFLQGVTPSYYMSVAGPKYVATLVGVHSFIQMVLMSGLTSMSGNWLNQSGQGLEKVAPVFIICAVITIVAGLIPLLAKRVDFRQTAAEVAAVQSESA